MKTGTIFDEPYSDYRSTECVGSHRLDDLLPYPIRYYLRYVSHEIPDREDTDEYRFGRALHTLALEGESVFYHRYVVLTRLAPPRPTRRQFAAKKPSAETVEAIEWWNAFLAIQGNREIITEESFDLAWRMVDSIRAKGVVRDLFTAGKPEVTFRHKMASFGIQSRIDWFSADAQPAPMITDLKSISSLEAFDYQYDKYGYFRQAAFYRLVVAKVLGIPPAQIQFSFAVVEKQPPYLCARRDPDAQSLEKGEEEVLERLRLLKSCYDSGNWPGTPDVPMSVSLPEWKTRRE